MGQDTVKLKDTDHKIELPPFAEREDIAIAYGAETKHPRRQARALAGALGLCVPALGLGGLEAYEELDHDLVKYGGRVYSAAMAEGYTQAELMAASAECFTAVCGSLFPREPDVEAAANFTTAPEEQLTA